jgi:hypothetical protein
VKLRCTQFPVAGQVTGFAFDSPLGFVVLRLVLGPAPEPSVTVGPGLLCSTGTLNGTPAILANAVGSPATISFPLPTWLAGMGLVVQGVAVEPAACLALSDPLAITVHAP